VRYMRDNKDLFSMYFDGDKEYDTYVSQMSQNKACRADSAGRVVSLLAVLGAFHQRHI
jgi:hypothetical protein